MSQKDGHSGYSPTRLQAAAPRGVAGRFMPWLLTFGDLLTLLLCFFMFLVSKGAIGRKQQVENTDTANPAPQVNQQVAVSKPVEAESGTTIATYQNEAESLRLTFNEDDFSADGERLSDRALGRLLSSVKSAKYEVGSMKLETCMEAVDNQEGRSWTMSIARSLAMRSQLIDAGFRGELLALRGVGSHCEALRSDGAGREDTVARARVVFTNTAVKRQES